MPDENAYGKRLNELLQRFQDRATHPRPVELEDRANLAASLLSLRRRRGLSQAELSQLTGVEQADISRIERATVDPRVSTVLRILAGLDAQLTFVLATAHDEPAIASGDVEETVAAQALTSSGAYREAAREADESPFEGREDTPEAESEVFEERAEAEADRW